MSQTTKPAKRGRHTVARHGELKTPHPFAQIMKVLAVALAVVLVSGTGVAAFAVWDSASAIANQSVDIGEDQQLPPTIGEIEGGVNVLLVGTDSCEGQDTKLFPRCKHDPGGERNDVTMLVHISDDPRRVTVVSFPRDMMVPIPSCPDGEGGNYSAMSSQMMNASYMYGGLACTALTVEELTGEDVHFAAAIRWTGVINMSDAVGGVDVCVSDAIKDKHTGLKLSKGNHTLVGAQALQFLRIRHGIGDGSDLGRISNQQQFMGSLVRKLQGEGVLSNPQTLFNIATTAMQQVNSKQLVMSKGLANPTRMVQIAMAVKSVPYDDIVFVQYPTVYAKGDGASRVMPVRDAADVLFEALRENKPIKLTGEASQGFGVEVTGEATPKPTASASPSPTDSATPGSTATAEPEPTDEAVELPDSIAGSTAAQVTCTRAEK